MALNNPTIGSASKSSEVEKTIENKKVDTELNEEYRDERYITISSVKNYSNYRRVNFKSLGPKKETIGSSITSCRILSSNADEVAAYFPALIGISSNHPDFVTRVKSYLSNIQLTITDKDVKLNASFIYKHKSDYLKIKEEEDKINEKYDKINKANEEELRKGLNEKIDSLNRLESTKYKYGRPENVEEYLMYRHCLLYSEVAKDTVFINSNPRIRFYIKDEAKEAELQKRIIKERSVAMRNFVELDGSDEKFNAVYIAICQNRGDNLAEALLKDRTTKTNIIMNFVNENPDKFNKYFNDKNIELKAFIETLILRGELVRSDFNQQIALPDGTFVGANINEAITWFANPNNAGIKQTLQNKIDLLK